MDQKVIERQVLKSLHARIVVSIDKLKDVLGDTPETAILIGRIKADLSLRFLDYVESKASFSYDILDKIVVLCPFDEGNKETKPSSLLDTLLKDEVIGQEDYEAYSVWQKAKKELKQE